MAELFPSILREQTDAIIGVWVDEIYADRRTDLALLLSYSQLVNHMPDLLDELMRVLDDGTSYGQIVEAAWRLRFHAQVRFRQGCLIDEVARELMILREVLNDFLWREGLDHAGGDVRELREALWRTDVFVDELIAQAIVIYAANLRPSVPTRTSIWPPPYSRERGARERSRQ